MPIDAELVKKVNNYIEDATDNGPGNDLWTSTTVQNYTVPAGKRWIVIGGVLVRDVSSTAVIVAHDSAGKEILSLANASAGTGRVTFPAQTSGNTQTHFGAPFILDAGELIKITCGTAQGAGGTLSCVVLEIDI